MMETAGFRAFFSVATILGIVVFGSGRPGPKVRFATYNCSLHRETQGELVADLQTPDNAQARKVAEIIQRVRPDVLLLCEFDYDSEEKGGELFQKNYLELSQQGQQPIFYPYRFLAPVNTGVPIGMDLNGNGETDDPNDTFGFGKFPGQYGMVVFSMLPIDTERVRTFQHFCWRDMPSALHPVREDGRPFYAADAFEKLRLSSKSHWDLPIAVGDRQVHFITFHPTPPVFDGPEDANGRRNHDEIRLAADYIDADRGGYLYDDQGQPGGLAESEAFVVAGDMNADPWDGDSYPGAIDQLLSNRRIAQIPPPQSRGGVLASRSRRKIRRPHLGNPANDTSNFGGASKNLRVDYVLPSAGLRVLASGVFWPVAGEEGAQLVGASDHRLVWVDLELDPTGVRYSN